MTLPPLTIVPLQPEHHAAARELLLGYLAERWGSLDPALNADLDDFNASYAETLFVTAWLQDELVGTGALLHEENITARIVRMTVAKPLRGQGIGRKIVQYLCQEAQARGYRRIVLETEAVWPDAIAFYQRCGFRPLGVWDGNAHFELVLPNRGMKDEDNPLFL